MPVAPGSLCSQKIPQPRFVGTVVVSQTSPPWWSMMSVGLERPQCIAVAQLGVAVAVGDGVSVAVGVMVGVVVTVAVRVPEEVGVAVAVADGVRVGD